MIHSFLIASSTIQFIRIQLAAPGPPLELVQTIPLPGVEGRIDHMAVHVKGKRLFVAALGNNTLEVVDLQTGRVQSVKGMHEPQGVAFVPSLNRIAVANGKSGELVMLDGKTLGPIRRVTDLPDADNVRYVA